MNRWILTLALSIAAGSAGAAEKPAVIEYEGRITASGEPFSGEGLFKFALLDAAGEQKWTSDESIPLAVADGTYRVRLGDPVAGMEPLPPEATANWQSLRIRTWFNDGAHGWAEAGVTALSKAGGSASLTAPTTTSDDATLQAILLEMRRLRSEVATLRQEVRATKTASSPRPTTPAKAKTKPKAKKPVQVSLAEAVRHSLGSPDAPVVLVEFTDFECGFCKRFFDQTLPQLQEKYIDNGKLRFVSRNYPIKSHPQARPAAQALLSAAAQDSDQYWAMRAWLFENMRELGEERYVDYAKEAGLDVSRFLADGAAQNPKLDEDVAAAKSVGITGTPSFVLGTSDGKMIHGERIVGAKSFQVFSDKIEALLSAQAK